MRGDSGGRARFDRGGARNNLGVDVHDEEHPSDPNADGGPLRSVPRPHVRRLRRRKGCHTWRPLSRWWRQQEEDRDAVLRALDPPHAPDRPTRIDVPGPWPQYDRPSFGWDGD